MHYTAGKGRDGYKKKVAIVELTCIATALYFIQEESREYDIFLKLLKRNMNVRLKILCFDWFQT